MKKETLLELLNSENFKATLHYMRVYENMLRSGISYEDLQKMMDYDYEIYLSKINMIKNIDITEENAVYRLNEISSIQTNIKSNEDALCKSKALLLANDNIYNE